MGKPTVIYGTPIIATKDANWIERNLKNIKAVPGAIWLLPEDAILIMPEITEVDNILDSTNSPESDIS